MIRWSNLFALAGLLVSTVLGCSDDAERRADPSKDAGDATDSQSSDGATEAGEAGAVCVTVNGAVFAVDTLYFGELDWEGYADPSAWMLFGSDVDGVDSTAASTGLCQPAAGATKEDVYPDGDGGVDNAFGKVIVPLLSTVSSDFSARVNDTISAGLYTWLFKVDPFGPAQSSVSTNVYAAGELGRTPLFDGTDCWRVARASVHDPADVDSARISFETGSIVSNRLVTGTPAKFQLMVPIAGTVLRLTAHQAKIAIDFDSQKSGAIRGTMSGVLETEEFIEEARDVLGFLDPEMCDGPSFEYVAASIRKASDIMSDGTQDPSSTCNGISIGIGFTMTKAGISGVDPTMPQSTDPCP